MPVLYLPLIGFFAGMLIISLGGGGGAVYVGVLTGLCGIAPDVAASVSLATAIPTTLMGAFSHYRAGNVNIRLALYVLVGTAVGSVAGSLCSGLLPLRFYNMLTGLILLILALQMTWHCIYPPKREIKDADSLTMQDKLKAMAYGLLGGVMSGLLGVTGGAPLQPACLYWAARRCMRWELRFLSFSACRWSVFSCIFRWDTWTGVW